MSFFYCPWVAGGLGARSATMELDGLCLPAFVLFHHQEGSQIVMEHEGHRTEMPIDLGDR